MEFMITKIIKCFSTVVIKIFEIKNRSFLIGTKQWESEAFFICDRKGSRIGNEGVNVREVMNYSGDKAYSIYQFDIEIYFKG